MTERIFETRKCNKCRKVIAIIYQIDNGKEYTYRAEDTPERYIDKWGFSRNCCKDCMK